MMKLGPVVVLMVVTALVSCDEGDLERNSAATQTTPDPIVSGGPMAGVQEVVDDVQDSLRVGSGWGVCRELSEAGQAVLGGGAAARCEDAVSRAVARRRATGVAPMRSTVISLDTDGPRPTATVRDADGCNYRTRFTRDRGAWVLLRADLDAPSGLLAE